MIAEIHSRLQSPVPVVVATVVSVSGSTPQVVGCKALIDADGAITGTLGGGMLEAEAQRRGAAMCGSASLITFEFSMNAEYSREAGPICGGSMHVMLDSRRELLLPVYQAASLALANRGCGVILTPLEGEAPPRWVSSNDVEHELDPVLRKALHATIARNAATVTGSDPVVFIDPVCPPPRLLVVGAGHVGHAVAELAQRTGFDVTVLDDRPEFTNPARFAPGIATHHGVIADMVRGFGIDTSTYVVLVSKGHKPDAEALEACIATPAAYLGMIGSRRKVLEIKADFLKHGLATEAAWTRIHAPIGLDIGAVTVPEIAVSIVAELIATRRQRAESSPEALGPQ